MGTFENIVDKILEKSDIIKEARNLKKNQKGGLNLGQPKSRMKKVWNVDEHQSEEHGSQDTAGGKKFAYQWPKGTGPGPSSDYTKFIL